MPPVPGRFTTAATQPPVSIRHIGSASPAQIGGATRAEEGLSTAGFKTALTPSRRPRSSGTAASDAPWRAFGYQNEIYPARSLGVQRRTVRGLADGWNRSANGSSELAATEQVPSLE